MKWILFIVEVIAGWIDRLAEAAGENNEK